MCVLFFYCEGDGFASEVLRVDVEWISSAKEGATESAVAGKDSFVAKCFPNQGPEYMKLVSY